MKFSLLYEELKFSDVFSSATPEEVEDRQKRYIEVFMSDRKKTKLPDGSWHVHEPVFLPMMGLKSLKELNVSKVDGGFHCSHQKLSNLEGAPTKVSGFFGCAYNKITSLEGSPRNVGGFDCSYNYLTNLVGAPEICDNTFNCSDNAKLTSLEGCPEIIGCHFFCVECIKLMSLDYGPRFVHGDYRCYGCGEKFIEDDVIINCRVKGEIWV